MTKEAKIHVSIPAVHVPSERLFSIRGLIVTRRLQSLLKEYVKQLVFLRENLK